jgi:purine-nucleoside phosphorylase
MAAAILTDTRIVSEVRGIRAYTGLVSGRPLTILASGMGMPSIAIYATELFRFFGVERIIRLGTAGGLGTDIGPGDVVIATAAHTTSSMNDLRIPGLHFAAAPDFGLAVAAWQAAQGNPRVKAGPVVSNDHFYRDFLPGFHAALAQHGVLASEMEAAGLYGVAAAQGKAALTIVTVSDHLVHDHQHLSIEQREGNFDLALHLALAAVFS